MTNERISKKIKRILYVLPALFFFYSVYGCSGGSKATEDLNKSDPPPTSETKIGGAPPTVSLTVPTDGAIDVEATYPISVTFSEAMDEGTITADNFIVGADSSTVSGTLSYDRDSMTALFVPDVGLSQSTVYTVTITTGITNAAGNPLAQNYVFSFTTWGPTSVNPPSGVGTSPTAKIKPFYKFFYVSSRDGESGEGPYNLYLGYTKYLWNFRNITHNTDLPFVWPTTPPTAVPNFIHPSFDPTGQNLALLRLDKDESVPVPIRSLLVGKMAKITYGLQTLKLVDSGDSTREYIPVTGASWSPDGSTLYVIGKNGPVNLLKVDPTSGAASIINLFDSSGNPISPGLYNVLASPVDPNILIVSMILAPYTTIDFYKLDLRTGRTYRIVPDADPDYNDRDQISPALSWDGKVLFYVTSYSGLYKFEIKRCDLDPGASSTSCLNFKTVGYDSDRHSYDSPAPCPDGTVLFSSDRDTTDPSNKIQRVYMMNADGTNIVNMTSPSYTDPSNDVEDSYPACSPI